MIEKITFSGYKSFKGQNELEIKPITILFGKNSSGKSSVAKLPILIEASLSGKYEEPIIQSNKDVEFGADFRDLFYNRVYQEQMSIELVSNGNVLSLDIINSVSGPLISKWSFKGEEEIKIAIHDYEEAKNNFVGFLLKEKEKQIKDSLCIKTDYIGPFRLNPPRIFYLKGRKNYKKIGLKGNNAYQMLIQDEELLQEVNDWYEKNFDVWGLSVKRMKPYYELNIKHKDSLIDGVNLVDVGQGMSQALPIIVQAYRKGSKTKLNIVEQPELHLHPAAHGNLAELIYESIKKGDNKYLVETHSKNFILRIRTLIAEGKLDRNLCSLYYVDFDTEEQSSKLKKINIDDKGEVDYWPGNVFDETFEEIKALMRAQKNRD